MIKFFLFFPFLLFAEISQKDYRDCSNGNYSSCYRIGSIKLSISSPDYDIVTGLDYMNSSCNGGFSRACFALGRYYESLHDLDKARYFFGRSCELKDSSGCYRYNLGGR